MTTTPPQSAAELGARIRDEDDDLLARAVCEQQHQHSPIYVASPPCDLARMQANTIRTALLAAIDTAKEASHD